MTKYFVDGENEFKTADNVAEYIIENMDDSTYDKMLDECYGDIEICGCTYTASLALARVDEVAYNCGRNDYYDGLRPDIVDKIESMDKGEISDVYGYEVEYAGEEEEAKEI